MSIEQHLSREFLRVVEEAAIAASRTMGQGQRRYSDQVAVEAGGGDSVANAVNDASFGIPSVAPVFTVTVCAFAYPTQGRRTAPATRGTKPP